MSQPETLQQALASNFFTVLKDRVLFFDGDTVISPDKVEEYAGASPTKAGLVGNICVTELTKEIEQYNGLVENSDQIHIKEEFKDFDLSWNIPDQYKELDVVAYVSSLFDAETKNLTYDEAVKRAYRVQDELDLYEQLNLLPILRVIIYVINTLDSHDVVWGIGRGSCVSSYVLYLIGVHDVDSVAYDLDYTDFLRISEHQDGEHNG